MLKDLSFKDVMQRSLLVIILISFFGVLFWHPYEEKQQTLESGAQDTAIQLLEKYNNVVTTSIDDTSIVAESSDTLTEKDFNNGEDVLKTDSIVKEIPLSHICSDISDPYCIARIRTAVYLELKFEIEVSKIIERDGQLFYPLTQKDLDEIAYNSAPEIAKE